MRSLSSMLDVWKNCYYLKGCFLGSELLSAAEAIPKILARHVQPAEHEGSGMDKTKLCIADSAYSQKAI